ncbi:MAG: T9SS type A sorting domain-containing protein [Ignavibacteria bacterium]|nr:T9SS type A sorting domain-containing protein [Ignavibacteria bacterium]
MKYLVGLDGYALNNRGPYEGYYQIPVGGNMLLDENSSGSNSADAEFGYGIWKLALYYVVDEVFYLINSNPIILDYRDMNYSYGGANSMAVDLDINIYNTTGLNAIKYRWFGGPGYTCDEISLFDPNLPILEQNIIKCYKQYHKYINGNLLVPEVTPNIGIHGISKSDELLYPIDGTNSSIVPSPYTIPYQENPGKLYSPLYINFNHHAKIKCGKIFSVENGSYLLLYSTNNGFNYAQFTVGDNPTSNCNAVFINQTGGYIYLLRNTQFFVENGSQLYLEKNSHISMNNFGAAVRIKTGSTYCNKGAFISGGKIIIDRGVTYCIPDPPSRISNYLQDSANVILETGAEFVIPDSTTYIFEGNETALICNDSSTIKFGKGSKLIFEDGARINANGCKFTSYDSTDTWDGIYLSDDANDTLINCVIQNAYNGINITQPTSIGLTEYSTVINNCTFKNTTSTKLLNQVYIDGADDILIKDCSTESGISSGFASCIVMQYCPSGSVVITDNSFSNCDIGITAIQSSPYIARNTITGLTGSGTGLYLDNSNGTIEYNIVNNFEKSVECSYSSPYLLKNTFNNASDMIVQLYSASVPVMRPVNSGTVTRWLGGNNILAGMPVSGAMVLEKESYPMMDSGYNLISVNGYNYISGELDGDLEATMNYWFDSPPVTAYFDVSGGEVIYDPLFNGTSLPNMDYFELNSIGFGMYDSVFVIDNGDNPFAGSLFMQAYSNEMSGNYSTAISKYKDVVSEYKTSTFATVSLARIFNCLEKNNGSVTDYNNIQSYYANIKSDTNNTKESREISEDFVIKSKVRQGNIMEAVSDYDNIYQNNQNTHKGTHALLNKLCLLKYGSGGDNPNSGSTTESKINVLSLISGKTLNQNISSNTKNTPRSFKLHQNYPNPFNPTTTIRYEIPLLRGVSEGRGVFITIKIYDLLGREVFSVNEYKQAGSYEMEFDGSDLASGLYIYQINSGVFSDSKKMVLIK